MLIAMAVYDTFDNKRTELTRRTLISLADSETITTVRL